MSYFSVDELIEQALEYAQEEAVTEPNTITEEKDSVDSVADLYGG